MRCRLKWPLSRLDRLIKKPPRHEKDSEAEMGENETSSVRKVQKDAGESSSSKANQRKSSTRRSSSLERYQIRWIWYWVCYSFFEAKPGKHTLISNSCRGNSPLLGLDRSWNQVDRPRLMKERRNPPLSFYKSVQIVWNMIQHWNPLSINYILA